MRVVGRRFDNGETVAVEFQNGIIDSIAAVQTQQPAPWLAPGFVDLQINGYGGQEFNDLGLTVEKVATVSRSQDAFGVTSYLPTTTTHSFEMLSHALGTIARACQTDREVDRRVAGIHLEGPYIGTEDGPRGAHPRQHCRPPDWDEFQRLQDAAGGSIRILTLSPEYEGAPEFIAKVAATGVLVAIGHTGANSQQIRAAVDAGARMSTHLGNGAHGQIRRHPNYIWDQLAEDRLIASLIVDGHHLPPEVVKTFVRAKTTDRCVLVSDLVGMAGMPAGRYERSSLGDIDIVDDGRIFVAGQRQFLAGASLPISVGVANLTRFADVDLKTAVQMASSRPAALIGREVGELRVGGRADLVQFDLPENAGDCAATGLQIRCTINAGEAVHGRPWQPS